MDAERAWLFYTIGVFFLIWAICCIGIEWQMRRARRLLAAAERRKKKQYHTYYCTQEAERLYNERRRYE